MSAKIQPAPDARSPTLASPGATPWWKTMCANTDVAFWAVAMVVRNASLCSGVAWLVTFCFSQGNVLSFSPVREQSYTSFFAADVVMTALLSSIMAVMTLAQVLRYQYIADNLERVPSLWLCFTKLLRYTIVALLATLVMMVAIVYLVSLMPVSVRFLKLEFYLNVVLNHLFLCYADLTTRRIIRQETTRRQTVVSTRDGGQLIRQGGLPRGISQNPQQLVQRQRRLRRPRSSCGGYWRHFFSTFPITLFVLLAGLYVHATKNVKITEAQAELVLFTCGSILFKMGMQELAKWAALRKNVRDVRMMCVVVGVPTVLIDTQIRLVVQRPHTTQGTISGSLLMALVEIVMRITKLGLVKPEVYHHEKAGQRSPTVATLSPFSSKAVAETARWKRSTWKLYMAEVYADMAAEYIAIGCSTSILFFYRTHPKYQLIADKDTQSGLNQLEVVAAQVAIEVIVVVAAQVAIEVIVDIVACSLEIRQGMDFLELRKYGAFTLTFVMHLAIVNIQISSAVYMIS